MNIEINPDFEKSTTLRALSAFLTLLADEADGETKDQKILSAIVQKGLNHVPTYDSEAGAKFVADAALMAQADAAREEGFASPAEVVALVDKVEQPAPPKRTRRTKAEMEADKAVEQGNVAPVAEEKAAPATDSATVEQTIDDVRAALQRYTAVHGMPDGIALLKNYGAGRISELGVEQYPLFIAECDAVEAA